MQIPDAILDQNTHYENSYSLSALSIPAPSRHAPLEPAELADTVAGRLRQIAGRFPKRPAYVTLQESLSYAELDRTSNRIARAIHQRLGKSRAAVGLCVDPMRSSMVAGHVGAVYSGRPYVALDPGVSRERLAYVLRDSGAALVLTDDFAEPLAQELTRAAGIPIVNLDQLDAAISDTHFEFDIAPDDPVYIVYTSGSTGVPKGVVWASRTRMLATWLLNRHFHLHPEDRFSMLHSYGFNSSSAEFWTALLEGACVYPYDFHRQGIRGLGEWVRRAEITILHWIPSALRTLDAELSQEITFPSVRALFLMSEPVTEREVAIHRSRFTRDSVLVNRYGTTETGIATHMVIGRETSTSGSRVRSGYALPGKEVLILDPAGAPAGPGEEGEIVIRSEFMSSGYWRRPEENRARFKEIAGSRERMYFTGDRGRIDPDGCLEHLGRLDGQVKVRGYRVETGEVEAALRRLPEVRDAVAVVRGAEGEAVQQLVAYVVPRDGSLPTVNRLRAAFAGGTAVGMMPDRFMLLRELPRTATGKIDVRALPDPGTARPVLDAPYAAPESPLEERLVGIWAEVLGIDPVGRDDPFAELGGNSLRMAQVLARIEGEWGVQISPADFYAGPTVRRQAIVVLDGLAAISEGAGLAELLAEIEAPGRRGES